MQRPLLALAALFAAGSLAADPAASRAECLVLAGLVSALLLLALLLILLLLFLLCMYGINRCHLKGKNIIPFLDLHDFIGRLVKLVNLLLE